MGRIVRQANEMSNDGHVLRAYLFMPDGYTPLLMIEYDEYEAVDACYAYHNDHLSTPRAMTDDSGAVIWRASLAPFGQRIGACDTDQDGADDGACPVEQPLRFPGQREDAGTGLYYNWHRYYVPGLGVYTRLDPVGTFGPRAHNVASTGYAGGSPVMATDAAGLWPIGDETAAHSGAPTEQEAADAAQALAGMLLAPLALLGGCDGPTPGTEGFVQQLQNSYYTPALTQCLRQSSGMNVALENCPREAREACETACNLANVAVSACEQVCRTGELDATANGAEQLWNQLHPPAE